MKKIALLSNITINMIEKELRQNYLIYIPNGYDTWISEIFNKTSSLFSFLPEAIVVLLDGTEFNGYVDINKVKEKLLLYQNALNNLTLETHYEYYEKQGFSKKDVIKKIAKDRGVNKNEIYKYFIK